jgi:hypothetical protein
MLASSSFLPLLGIELNDRTTSLWQESEGHWRMGLLPWWTNHSIPFPVCCGWPMKGPDPRWPVQSPSLKFLKLEQGVRSPSSLWLGIWGHGSGSCHALYLWDLHHEESLKRCAEKCRDKGEAGVWEVQFVILAIFRPIPTSVDTLTWNYAPRYYPFVWADLGQKTFFCHL